VVTLTLAIAPIRESLVVTATRSDAAPAITGSSTTVISSEDVARRGSPVLADLLGTTPGIVVTPSGGLGTVTSVFVRGGESDYNKVLLDGIPLNEPGGSFNFSNFTTNAVERVEIVRGAMSALFGSDAMASVIQVFSVRGTDGAPARVSAFVEGGGYGTRRMDSRSPPEARSIARSA
jgi:vitamin B12 transporter